MAERQGVPAVLGPAVDEALAELRRLAPRYVGTEAARAEVVRVQERTHSTCVVLGLASPTGAARRFYLKVLESTPASRELKRGQLLEEYRLLEDLSLRFAPHPGLGVVAPVRCWPSHLALLTEEFPGQSLDAVIGRAKRFQPGRRAGQARALCGLVGRWLALFQMFTKPADAPTVGMGELLGYCARRLKVLVDAPGSGFDAGLGVAVRSHLERLAATVDPADLAPVGRQNDFRPDNVVTDGARIAVLDFTGFTHGPALYDFMKFWMKLDDFRFGPFFGATRVAGWQAAFTEGYGGGDLGGPLARFLALANRLDKLSEALDGPAARRSPRGLLARRWYDGQLRALCAAVTGAPEGAR